MTPCVLPSRLSSKDSRRSRPYVSVSPLLCVPDVQFFLSGLILFLFIETGYCTIGKRD